jgi:hypothetical protein
MGTDQDFCFLSAAAALLLMHQRTCQPVQCPATTSCGCMATMSATVGSIRAAVSLGDRWKPATTAAAAAQEGYHL